MYGGNNGVSGVKKWAESEIWDEQGKLTSEAEPYTRSKSILKANHPVMIMVSEQRTQLLGHPLCMALVRNKWNSLGRYVYYGTLILYLLFVGLLTNFVLDTPAPYRVVLLNFTPEIEVFYMLFERSLSIFNITYLRHHIEYINFRCKIHLNLPVQSVPDHGQGGNVAERHRGEYSQGHAQEVQE